MTKSSSVRDMFRREITSSGERSFKKLPSAAQRALLDASAVLDGDPYHAGEKLHGPLSFLYSFHFKHQNVLYRMAYTINEQQHVVYIHYVGPRGHFYERLRQVFLR